MYVSYEIKFEKKNKNKIWDKFIDKLFKIIFIYSIFSDFKYIIQNTIRSNKIIKQIKCLPRN